MTVGAPARNSSSRRTSCCWARSTISPSSALRGGGAARREQLNRATERAIRRLGEQLLATGRFPHISALFDGLSDKQSAALVTSTTEDERFELGLTAILDRFDPAAAARWPTRKR